MGGQMFSMSRVAIIRTSLLCCSYRQDAARMAGPFLRCPEALYRTVPELAPKNRTIEQRFVVLEADPAGRIPVVVYTVGAGTISG
jgi:hypothetical protein